MKKEDIQKIVDTHPKKDSVFGKAFQKALAKDKDNK